jgi:hypothetical protein
MTEYWFSVSDESDCKYAASLQRFVQAILEHFRQTGISASQLEQILASLLSYKEALAHTMDTLDSFHFSASNGGHRCLEACYQEAVIKLQLLPLLKPAVELPTPPAPPQPQMTLEDVVRAFGEPVQPYDDTTYIGTDDDEQDDW